MPDTTGGGGDVIIGAVDVNGTFKPEDKMRSGVTLAAGDTFDLTAIGYDLAIIKELGDSLLNGTSNSQPCCNLFTVLATALSKPELAGFCDSVNNAGIYGANDINDAEDLLTIFDPFFSGQVSVGAVIWTLQVINSNGSFISTDCGGTGNNNFVPYGINRNQRYSYETGSTVMTTVNELSAVTLFMLYPNPVTGKTLNLNFTTTQEVDLSIQVYDVLGQTVLAKDLGTVQGNFQTAVSTEGLTSGVYTVALSDGNHTELRKVVIR